MFYAESIKWFNSMPGPLNGFMLTGDAHIRLTDTARRARPKPHQSLRVCCCGSATRCARAHVNVHIRPFTMAVC